MVRFRTPRGEFALPVEQVTEVRRADDLVLLPSPKEGVAGVIRHGDGVLPVLSVLGEPGQHVVVVQVDDARFGLLVEEVTAIRRVEDGDVGPPPRGQEGAGVSAAIVEPDGIVLVLDPAALRARLGA
jgi:chemotaxis signal transduction protein